MQLNGDPLNAHHISGIKKWTDEGASNH